MTEIDPAAVGTTGSSLGFFMNVLPGDYAPPASAEGGTCLAYGRSDPIQATVEADTVAVGIFLCTVP